MIVRFDEEFKISIEEMYGYFKSPEDWTRIFGFPGNVRRLDDGWFSVPLRGFPFPLVAKNTFSDPPITVRWAIRGFWIGSGEIHLKSTDAGVHVEGFEMVSVKPLWIFSPIVEKIFLEKSFQRIWEVGWRRLRIKGE